ncbi:hypothetical protein BRC86_06895 [Halobacteriales archaeon QS_3_64_16]|nr:MAG: hypothetical protein BRC86_06895 [Halobacteriales archaeon QS_3_64_16]
MVFAGQRRTGGSDPGVANDGEGVIEGISVESPRTRRGDDVVVWVGEGTATARSVVEPDAVVAGVRRLDDSEGAEGEGGAEREDERAVADSCDGGADVVTTGDRRLPGRWLRSDRERGSGNRRRGA